MEQTFLVKPQKMVGIYHLPGSYTVPCFDTLEPSLLLFKQNKSLL